LLGITYLVACVLVGVFQRRILYFPFHKTEDEMVRMAEDLGCSARLAAPWWREVSDFLRNDAHRHLSPP
jgi:hypothetical protein